MQFQLTPVSLDQFGEGIRIAGLRPGDKISVDENPPIGSRPRFHLSGYWYRRRAKPKRGTPARFSGRRASTCTKDTSGEPENRGDDSAYILVLVPGA